MLPLTGVTILAVEQYGAGPFGSMLCGDLGADVIKIEPPGGEGELGRRVGPHFFAPGDSHFFQAFNRNKRSITLDLKSAEGADILRRLATGADAVLNNLRGDQPEKLGLTYAQLAAVNPRIVCAHLSAYGRTGSRRSWPGFDYLMQAEAGYLSVTGEPDGPPSRRGLSIVDFMTGLMTVFAMTSSIIGARASGRGQDVDVSLFDTALHNLSYLSVWYLSNGHVQGREPRSGHPSLVPSQLYRTQDGWIFIMCNKENFWAPLCEVIGRPEWVHDARYATFKARLDNRDELNRLLDEALSARTTDAWMTVFAGKVPAAPVLDIAQALDNPFVAEREGVRSFARSPQEGEVRMLASPIRVPGETLPTRAAPGLGAHTEEVLRGLGLGEADIAKLRANGIV
ncbi:MAG: CoA transferase [Hyphomicrobiaceae bacterium]|nr:CoA transferase [Hyphomicrobiaceae bacterium]